MCYNGLVHVSIHSYMKASIHIFNLFFSVINKRMIITYMETILLNIASADSAEYHP